MKPRSVGISEFLSNRALWADIMSSIPTPHVRRLLGPTEFNTPVNENVMHLASQMSRRMSFVHVSQLIRLQTLSFHDLMHYRVGAFEVSHFVTLCHVTWSCINLIMHRPTASPDVMHYEVFNCTLERARSLNHSFELSDALSVVPSMTTHAICCYKSFRIINSKTMRSGRRGEWNRTQVAHRRLLSHKRMSTLSRPLSSSSHETPSIASIYF
jgi:hypothetical protein